MTLTVTRSSPGALRRLGDDLGFATIVALTRTGQRVRDGLVDHMRGAIDRPTPWTLAQLRLWPATKARPFAEVMFRQGAVRAPAAEALRAMELGVRRYHKRFERVMIGAGVMQADEYAYPAKGYPLDGYGNIPGRTIVQILSQLQAFGEMGYRANATAATLRRRMTKGQGRYFVPQADSALPRGVYERWGVKAIRAVMLFAYSADYRPTLRFKETGYAIARQSYPAEFQRAFADAVRRASRGSLTATTR